MAGTSLPFSSKCEVMPDQNLHEQQLEKDNCTNLIIQSTAKNKIIVADCGTGKRQLLEAT